MPRAYTQAALSSDTFTKRCICPEGGPSGTRRYRNRAFCQCDRTAHLEDEAGELQIDILDGWETLNHNERKTKAYRLAELRSCLKDGGRKVEVGEKMLRQLYEAHGEAAPGPTTSARHSHPRVWASRSAVEKPVDRLTASSGRTASVFINGWNQQNDVQTLAKDTNGQAIPKFSPPERSRHRHMPAVPTWNFIASAWPVHNVAASSETMGRRERPDRDSAQKIRQLKRRNQDLTAEIQRLQHQVEDAQTVTAAWHGRYERLMKVLRTTGGFAQASFRGEDDVEFAGGNGSGEDDDNK